ADASRFAILSGGEGIDDPNFDTELAKTMTSKLLSLLDFAKEHYNKGRDSKLTIDEWMENRINSIITATAQHYEETNLRSALQSCYFDMQNALKWYMRRCNNKPNKKTINKFIEIQTLLLAPITPFIAEEIWETIGKKGFIAEAEWPKAEKISEDKSEGMIKETLEDIHSVLTLLKITKPKKIRMFVAEKWKYDLYKLLKKELEKTRDFGKLMGLAMKKEDLKKYSKDITKIIQKAVKTGISDVTNQDKELKILMESTDFFKEEFNAKIEILEAEKSNEGKAKQALPGKVAILVE
ncbi:MAG: class I tRNA ligase family protein, partial [Nanoarchaeota archaeon]